jgi:hypothetical protein
MGIDVPWVNTQWVGKYFGYLPGIYPLTKNLGKYFFFNLIKLYISIFF